MEIARKLTKTAKLGNKKLLNYQKIYTYYLKKCHPLRQKDAFFQRPKSRTILSVFFCRKFFLSAKLSKSGQKPQNYYFMPMLIQSWQGVVVLINAMFSCCVLFLLVKESSWHSFGSDSDRLCYFVVEAGASCRRLLLRTCDSSLVPEPRDIQAWVELMEDDVVSDHGKTAVLEAELECFRGQFASPAEFDVC